MQTKARNLLEIYKAAPSWAKGVMIVSAIAGAGFGTYFIVHAVRKATGSRTSHDVANSSHDVYQHLLNSGQTLTFPETSYQATANTIQRLLDGCETPASESQVVLEIAKVVKKQVDWYKLVSIWGVRDIDNCGPFTGSTTYDLITLLKDQLNETLVMPYLTEYLTKIGITI